MKKITACVLVLILLAAVFPVGASASDEYEKYSIPTASNPTFHKYLTIKNGGVIPASQFGFTIEAGSGVTATGTTLGVLPGVFKNGKPSIANVSFAANAPTTAGAEGDGIVDTRDKKYASQAGTIDFSGVEFTEPGVYRYIITENAGGGTSSGVENDPVPERTLDVYIMDNGSGALTFGGYMLYSGTVTDAPLATDSAEGAAPSGAVKDDKYVNSVANTELTITKTVTGNQGSRDKFFKITVSLTGLGNGAKVSVEKTGYAAGNASKTSATSYPLSTVNGSNGNGVTELTANPSGVISHDFYLSDGDTVKLTGVPNGASYTVKEEPEGYTASAKLNGTAINLSDSGTAKQTAQLTLNDDSTLAFTNSRSGTVPTGVIVSVIPGFLIAALGVTGLIMIAKKRREEE